MTTIKAINDRYYAQKSLIKNGVEMVLVGDPIGEKLDRSVRALSKTVRERELGALEELESAAKALLWRQITRPQPLSHNVELTDICSFVHDQSLLFSNMIEDQTVLTDLAECAADIPLVDPPLGTILLESCQEVGCGNAIILAASHSAARGLRSWLEPRGLSVLTQGELTRLNTPREITYAVGPPKFFYPSLITSPVNKEVSFLFPSWFKDRTIPSSRISEYFEGRIDIGSKVFLVNNDSRSEPSTVVQPPELENYFPQPVWNTGVAPNEKTSDSVSARKVHLSGNYSIWLDDGERIRTINIHNAEGERVSYTNVKSVRRGTYLLLRQGVSEYGSLYNTALDALGSRANQIEYTQSAWKDKLSKRIDEYGANHVIRSLSSVGVSSPNRATAWVDKNLICPRRSRDLLLLLSWLDIPKEPSFSNAIEFRRQTYNSRWDVLKKLESTISQTDMNLLDNRGFLQLESEIDGFKGILATRVLAVSPGYQVVSKNDLRVPFVDRSAKWLE